jgi:hypothetical protein
MREKLLIVLLLIAVGVIAYDHLALNLQSVKAQGIRVRLEKADKSSIGSQYVRGSTVLGFSCVPENGESTCFMLMSE